MGTLARRFCIICLTGSAFSALVALITTLVGIYLIQISAQSILLVSGTAGSIAGTLAAALTVFKTRAKASQSAE